jgi:hypothetical protein
MERTRFGRIVMAALVAAMTSSTSFARAESCFVDLEEETSDQDQQYVLFVGRDDGGVVLCLGVLEDPYDGGGGAPAVVAWASQEGPCATDDGEAEVESEAGLTEIVVTVSGHNIALDRAPADLLCDDLAGISTYSEDGWAILSEYSDIQYVEEDLPVEVYNSEDDGYMALHLEANNSQGGGSIDSTVNCYLASGEYFAAYGVEVYNSVAYNNYMAICETLDDAVECIVAAPSDADDHVAIHAYDDGAWVFATTSTTSCGGLTQVAPWYAGWDGSMALYGSSTGDYLSGSPNGDFIEGGGGNDLLHGQDGDDTVCGEDGDDSVWGEGGADYISVRGREWRSRSTWGQRGTERGSTRSRRHDLQLSWAPRSRFA